MRTHILGVGFDDITINQAVYFALDLIERNEKSYVVTPNPEIIWMCRKNNELMKIINNAKLVLADGIGVTIGAKILGTPIKGGRVPGIDFISALFEKLAVRSGRIFLFGAKPGVANEAGAKLEAMYPGLIIAGVSDGYFTDSNKIVEQINASNADVLLVCLGAPKQELWMSEHLDKLNVPLLAGLGGSLDVFAGRVRRAPVFFQRAGLEWLYRIIKEPRRIRRSLNLPLFLLTVTLTRFRGG